MLGFLGIEQHNKLFDHLEDSCPQNMSPLPSLGAKVDGSEPARPVGGVGGQGMVGGLLGRWLGQLLRRRM